MPRCRAKAGDKGSNKELFSDWGQVSEERVRVSAGLGAEAEPAPPVPVTGLVVVFNLAVKDDAAI